MKHLETTSYTQYCIFFVSLTCSFALLHTQQLSSPRNYRGQNVACTAVA